MPSTQYNFMSQCPLEDFHKIILSVKLMRLCLAIFQYTKFQWIVMYCSFHRIWVENCETKEKRLRRTNRFYLVTNIRRVIFTHWNLFRRSFWLSVQFSVFFFYSVFFYYICINIHNEIYSNSHSRTWLRPSKCTKTVSEYNKSVSSVSAIYPICYILNILCVCHHKTWEK